MPDFLVPIALVVALTLLVPRQWMSGVTMRPFAVWVLLIATLTVIVRYLAWRFTETLPVSGTGFSEATFAWFLIVVEVFVWFDTAVLFLMLARRRNNSDAASAGEKRLRLRAPNDLPTIDIFIATYNEDIEVLEKTIAGAIALDWPKDRFTVYILDDGKREWLEKYSAQKGIEYFTRKNNDHAKAGNINAAIKRTNSEFFMVLDADFIPQQNFLYRAMGLFQDEKVGIVQIPHNFYNADPMQNNLGLRKVMPDDQRLFFDTIMVGRDGWDAAFCCGSNSITRRAAMEAIGGGMPTGSITEDMLLTLALLRKGYVTRYLNERLAVGLAPESLSAMYVQRARWARGAIQMLFLRDGPLGPGIKLRHRLMFLPLTWIVQPFMVIATVLTPIVCLWTGWSPLGNVSAQEILSLQVPAMLATLCTLRLIAPDSFFPLASTVHAALHAPRILPTVITTLIKPHGHAFKVTPKGSAAGGGGIDRAMIFWPIALILAAALGLYVNADIDSRVVMDNGQLPMLAFWAVISMVLLSIVQAVAVSPDTEQREERFEFNEPCTIATKPNEQLLAQIETLSLAGARIGLQSESQVPQNVRWLLVDIPEIGPVAANIIKHKGLQIEVKFHLPTNEQRNQLMRILFTMGRDNSTQAKGSVALALLSSIFTTNETSTPSRVPSAKPPLWLERAKQNVSKNIV
ncbi:glycosyltransferase [uncultured Sulfitobacter sp.]|uniref:glycosyltransferase n=1 Tax=uncultured Sulfitobacter sp. TaxID=191468 RepID=UPI0030FC1558